MGHTGTRGSCQAHGHSCCNPHELASDEGIRPRQARNEPSWKQAICYRNGVSNKMSVLRKRGPSPNYHGDPAKDFRFTQGLG